MPFDPDAPFEIIGSPQRQPARTFDPNAPFEVTGAVAPAPGRQPVTTWEDIKRAAEAGLIKGGIGLAGLPGDIAELGARGLDVAARYIGRQFGIPEEQLQRPGTQQRLSGLITGEAPQRETLTGFDLPGSAAIRQEVEQKLTGPLYEPQTLPGKYVGTAAEFIP